MLPLLLLITQSGVVHAQNLADPLTQPYGANIDRPFNYNTYLNTHDSFANEDEAGYSYLYANHKSSIQEQLDYGVRALSLRAYVMWQWQQDGAWNYVYLDTHGNKVYKNPNGDIPAGVQPDLYVAHGPDLGGGKLGYTALAGHGPWQRLSAVLGDIHDWLSRAPNRNQIVFLDMDDRTNNQPSVLDQFLQHQPIHDLIFFANPHAGSVNFTVTGEAPAAGGNGWDPAVSGYPTLRQLLSHGKQIVYMSNYYNAPLTAAGGLNSDELYEDTCWMDSEEDAQPASDWTNPLLAYGPSPYLIDNSIHWLGLTSPPADDWNFSQLNSHENLNRKLSLVRLHGERIPTFVGGDAVADFGDEEYRQADPNHDNRGPGSAARDMNALWDYQMAYGISSFRFAWGSPGPDVGPSLSLRYSSGDQLLPTQPAALQFLPDAGNMHGSGYHQAHLVAMDGFVFGGCNGKIYQFNEQDGSLRQTYSGLSTNGTGNPVSPPAVWMASDITPGGRHYLFVSYTHSYADLSQQGIVTCYLVQPGQDLVRMWQTGLWTDTFRYPTAAHLLPFHSHVHQSGTRDYALFVGYEGHVEELDEDTGELVDHQVLTDGAYGDVWLAGSPSSDVIYAGGGGGNVHALRVLNAATDYRRIDSPFATATLRGNGDNETRILALPDLRRLGSNVVDDIWAGSDSKVYHVAMLTNNRFYFVGGDKVNAIDAFSGGSGAVNLATDGRSVFAGSAGEVRAYRAFAFPADANAQAFWRSPLPRGTGDHDVNLLVAANRLFAGCQSYLFEVAVNTGLVTNTSPIQDGSYVYDGAYHNWDVTAGDAFDDTPGDVFPAEDPGRQMVFGASNGQAFAARIDLLYTLSASLSLSGTRVSPGGTAYAGPVQVILSGGNGRPNTTVVSYFNLDAKGWQAYDSPFTVSQIGTHSLQYYTMEFAGNRSALHTASFSVQIPPDTTPPVTTLTGLDATGFTLSATDPAPGSGVAYTLYRINGGQFTIYSGRVGGLSPDHIYTLEYASIDNASNIEAIHTVIILTPDVLSNDASSRVSVHRGALRYDYKTGRWLQPVTLTNISSASVGDPLVITVTLPDSSAWLNSTGLTKGAGGSFVPFLQVPTLALGQSTTVTLIFKPTVGLGTYQLSVVAAPVRSSPRGR